MCTMIGTSVNYNLTNNNHTAKGTDINATQNPSQHTFPQPHHSKLKQYTDFNVQIDEKSNVCIT